MLVLCFPVFFCRFCFQTSELRSVFSPWCPGVVGVVCSLQVPSLWGRGVFPCSGGWWPRFWGRSAAILLSEGCFHGTWNFAMKVRNAQLESLWVPGRLLDNLIFNWVAIIYPQVAWYIPNRKTNNSQQQKQCLEDYCPAGFGTCFEEVSFYFCWLIDRCAIAISKFHQDPRNLDNIPHKTGMKEKNNIFHRFRWVSYYTKVYMALLECLYSILDVAESSQQQVTGKIERNSFHLRTLPNFTDEMLIQDFYITISSKLLHCWTCFQHFFGQIPNLFSQFKHFLLGVFCPI